jgi:DNA-directed RNA polymerase subunit RPC12/RpoP
LTEYKCGNCKEVFVLSPKAKFCPDCGSSSLNLIIKELKEPAQKETLGVYSPRTLESIDAGTIDTAEVTREEEDQPRRRRR